MKAARRVIVVLLICVETLFSSFFVTGCRQHSDGISNDQSTSTKRLSSRADTSVIGRTVGEAVAILQLSFGRFLVIEEPPEVGRGVRGTDEAGEEFWVYIESIENPEVRHWKLEDFAAFKVIGIARRNQGQWQTSGKVIWYYHTQ